MTRLAQIKARVEAATKGPWRHSKGHGHGATVYHDLKKLEPGEFHSNETTQVIAQGVFERGQPPWDDEDWDSDDNAEFIAASREDVPFLLSLVEDLAAVAQAAEYAGDFCDGPACIVCSHAPWNEPKHSKDCPVGAVLRKVEE